MFAQLKINLQIFTFWYQSQQWLDRMLPNQDERDPIF